MAAYGYFYTCYNLIYKKREKFILLVALAVFSLALVFRTVDSMICPYFQIGTHFLWHILNGVLVYLSVRALICNLPVANSQKTALL